MTQKRIYNAYKIYFNAVELVEEFIFPRKYIFIYIKSTVFNRLYLLVVKTCSYRNFFFIRHGLET